MHCRRGSADRSGPRDGDLYGDAYYLPSNDGNSVFVDSFAPGGGTFVVGNQSATGSVTFWGAQWWKRNSLSGGAAPAAFKG